MFALVFAIAVVSGFRTTGPPLLPVEGGRIDEKRVLMPLYPVLDSRDGAVADNGKVAGFAHQTEGEADQEYTIAFRGLDTLSEGGCQHHR